MDLRGKFREKKKNGYWDHGLDLRGSGMESEWWGADINGGPGEAPGGLLA